MAAQQHLATTLPLKQIDPAQFDAVFYPGGHGPLWDLANDTHSIALIEAFVASGKPVGLVWFGWAVGEQAWTECQRFDGDRDTVRAATVRHGLLGLLQRLATV